MNAGPELDRLIAEKVMGLKIDDATRNLGMNPPLDMGETLYEFTAGPKPYSTDIAAAWEVVEKLKDTHYNFELSNDQGEIEPWICYFGQAGRAEAETAPLAICRAALRAMT